MGSELIVFFSPLFNQHLSFQQSCKDFSCSEIQEATYNIYFYFPNNQESYLGVANGLSQRGDVAYDYATSKNLSRNREWGYICCMKAKGSECYEKHR